MAIKMLFRLVIAVSSPSTIKKQKMSDSCLVYMQPQERRMTTIYRFLTSILLTLSAMSCFAQAAPTSADLGKEYAEYKKHVATGDWILSLTHARKSYEIGKVLFKSADKNNAALTYNYGHNLLELKQHNEARTLLNEALELYKTIYGDESKELLPVLTDLSLVEGEGLDDGNLKYQKQALEISEKNFGKDSLEHGHFLVEFGADNLKHGQSQLAKRNLYNGHEILAKHLPPSSEELAYVIFLIGKYQLSVNNLETAVEYLNKTLSTFKDPEKPSGQLELSTHGFLVLAYESLGKSDLATQHCLAIGRMTPDSPNQDIVPLFRKNPQYPYAELEAGKEGYAMIEFDVNESGFVINARAIESSGGNFETAAINAIEKWRYAPSFVEGKPVVRESAKTILKFEIAE